MTGDVKTIDYAERVVNQIYLSIITWYTTS